MSNELGRIWVYLAAQPLLWLTLTVAVFLAAGWLQRLGRGFPLLHPVLLSMAVLIGVLSLTGTDYDTYFDGAQFIHFLLGPATVAIAVPLYDNRHQIGPLLWPLLAACLAGVSAAAASAVGIAALLRASPQTLLSLAPKSVTSPIAMGIAEKLGGLPSLTAGMVLITGIFGALVAGPLFRWLRIRDERARGLALGVAAHGFGTAQALGISTLAGAFAGLGMGLAGVLTAFLLPLLAGLLGG
ncbi:LrgB family protein [Alkalilimnicola sp. S0819]|uniref:LrgB family protein n=1 Tax=Alkalilimnicola sp. S0819 TaxID=2613922 RepID=UPI0012622A85|nr:LrgB family protein [Alkalilimnicola sp. S0819]KAB7623338.1 LrgB family protein [Alkalilimnicola sp. S0819]MPQ16877.1 LrgB family protein [Alkalilimnicola sp. S0819]